MRILRYVVLSLGLSIVYAAAADFEYTINRSNKQVLFSVGNVNLSLSLFTSPAITGTPLLNPRVTDLNWLEVRKSAEGGNPEAAYLFAHKYLVTGRSYREPVHWLERAVAGGHGEAENDLGMMTMLGVGVTRDRAIAYDLFLRSSRKGVAMGHFNAALCQLAGVGCRRDYQSAKSHIVRAVQQRLATAELFMAFNHTFGTPIARKDYVKAYELVLSSRAHSEIASDSVSPRVSGGPFSGDASRLSAGDALAEYLESQLSAEDAVRIEARLSSILQVQPYQQGTYVQAIKAQAPKQTVLVFGPDEPSAEPVPPSAQ